ncbi:16S rRNA (cytosine(1402)-N(4))-methyltransferase RsmH [Oceanibacterium hippocampi]|uniref:Ribosomal RNA small subunit methyltransferase H n=1 Tax=Oceanibacterium hippocampi TaxID=745714 RepID=A0A1Y5SCZ4_9PROT|nr:16S rRNA (cytosine(1402)-N(4))-methyltransferase RsmH [Oceanibacterium hippocampi]SLN37209.1 Ribosomal RNA small subunit methyltransferase H [Oceanibacterium hippocampi]
MTAGARQAPGHEPVMLGEVVTALAPRDGAVYVDATFGGGGYSRAILEAARCRVVGIDRDPAARPRAEALAAEFGDRLEFVEGCFGDMERLLGALGIEAIDGVAFDFGVSSFQIDQAERGFSFSKDGPLDMRMGADGPTAADIVNELSEGELADIIYRYGEERRSRAVARAIVASRAEAPIRTTRALAALVARVVRKSGDIHPATRTFQSLRIHVNDELGEIERGLAAAERLLRPGGRLVVVGFHSLEDRIVKRFLIARAGLAGRPSRHQPDLPPAQAPSFELLHGGVTKPGAGETARNPRARSARLRAAVRTSAPSWPLEDAA